SRGRRHAKLRGRRHDERPDLPPVGAEREGELADGILAPLSRSITSKEVDADARLRMLRAVVSPQRQDGGGGPVAKRYPIILRAAIRNRGEVIGELLIKARGLRWKERRQGVVCRLHNGGLHGGPRRRRGQPHVALIATSDGIHRVEDG